MGLLLFAALCLQDDKTIEDLLRKLGDPSIEVREQACRELVKIGPKAIPHLEKLAGSNDPEMRERAFWTLKKIRARQRVAELGLEKLIPAEIVAKIPDLLDRAASDDPAEKVKLIEDLGAAVEAGTLAQKDLLWIGALLRGAVNATVRTYVYVYARRWWYDGPEAALREGGKKILEEMGEEFLRDWARVLVRIADAPNDGTIFDADVVSNNRGGSDEGQLSAVAIAELAEIGGVEIVPILADIASDTGADVAARKAALSAVGVIRKRWAARKKE